MAADVEVLVIGAGVIGLAIAGKLATAGCDTLVLEQAERAGTGTTSRNSQVIHAGLYYPPGSLKARLCLAGAAQLYAFCREHDVAALAIGKLIVAAEETELPALAALAANAEAAGATGLRRIAAADLAALEPNVRGVGALLSERSGVVDAAGYVAALERVARDAGVLFAFHHRVTSGWYQDGLFTVEGVDASGQPFQLHAKQVINAAGLAADAIASAFGIDVDAAGYRQRYVKGSYVALRPRPDTLVERLIYPLPLPGHIGLGVHLTCDTAGGWRLGPDAEPLDGRVLDYRVDPAKVPAFWEAARRLLPALRLADLAPDFAGIRPKLATFTGYPDFLIREESARGLPGLVNLIGIESPGLTASLAIADWVGELLHRSHLRSGAYRVS